MILEATDRLVRGPLICSFLKGEGEDPQDTDAVRNPFIRSAYLKHVEISYRSDLTYGPEWSGETGHTTPGVTRIAKHPYPRSFRFM